MAETSKLRPAHLVALLLLAPPAYKAYEYYANRPVDRPLDAQNVAAGKELFEHKFVANDPLTKDVGSTAARPQGGGKDALYLHYDGIFQGFDAHNLGAVGAAAVQLSLELNDMSSSRELYAAHRAGKAIATPSTEQLKARIVETKGTDWLWNPQVAMAGVSL